MLQHDEPDDYVIATGETHSVRQFAEAAFDRIGIDLQWSGKGVEEKGIDARTGKPIVTIAPQFFRPIEVDLLTGDYSKAKRELGWSPETTSKGLVEIMVDYDLRLVENERHR
jgi:GDPmannose 4,6-dehydratase